MVKISQDLKVSSVPKIFSSPSGIDPLYVRLATAGSDREFLCDGRAFTEDLWRKVWPFLDPDLPQKATRQFHQCFWEMYVAGALLDAGLPLMPRRTQRKTVAGPDLQMSPNIWVEAVAVTAGRGADAVTEAAMGVARQIPDEQIKLRLLSGLSEKRAKFDAYRTAGIVKADDVCIVALNAALVPSVRSERSVPRIVRSVFEFGHVAVLLDRVTTEITGQTNLHQESVAKGSGSLVGQGAFLDGSYSSIGACLYSAVDVINRPPQMGDEFVVVHNPTATPAVRPGFFSRGREFWLDGDHIRGIDHSSALPK